MQSCTLTYNPRHCLIYLFVLLFLLLPALQTSLGFHQFHQCPLPGPGSMPGDRTAFSCHVSPDSSGLRQFFVFRNYFLNAKILNGRNLSNKVQCLCICTVMKNYTYVWRLVLDLGGNASLIQSMGEKPRFLLLKFKWYLKHINHI